MPFGLVGSNPTRGTEWNAGRTGAMNIELLLPLANSIIENWKIGTFDLQTLLKNNQKMVYNQAYEY